MRRLAFVAIYLAMVAAATIGGDAALNAWVRHARAPMTRIVTFQGDGASLVVDRTDASMPETCYLVAGDRWEDVTCP